MARASWTASSCSLARSTPRRSSEPAGTARPRGGGTRRALRRRRCRGAPARECRALAPSGDQRRDRARGGRVDRERRDPLDPPAPDRRGGAGGWRARRRGVAFQALTRNPLAEPSVLGISGGAAFGVVIGQSFGLGLTVVEAVGLTGFAFAGALLAAAAVYLIAAVGRAAIQIQTLLLAGVI